MINYAKFKITKRTALNSENLVLFRLRPIKEIDFQSGDLMSISPQGYKSPRLYYIGRLGKEILISIQWYPNGICSSYLCSLNVGDTIQGIIKKNHQFHFPKGVTSVWYIADGPGIVPYLGSVIENHKTDLKLIWEGKTESSFEYYREVLEDTPSLGKNINYELAFSECNKKTNVQNILIKHEIKVAKTLKNGGVFMLFGSKKMQYSVLDTLEEITNKYLLKPLRQFQDNGKIITNCY